MPNWLGRQSAAALGSMHIGIGPGWELVVQRFMERQPGHGGTPLSGVRTRALRADCPVHPFSARAGSGLEEIRGTVAGGGGWRDRRSRLGVFSPRSSRPPRSQSTPRRDHTRRESRSAPTRRFPRFAKSPFYLQPMWSTTNWKNTSGAVGSSRSTAPRSASSSASLPAPTPH